MNDRAAAQPGGAPGSDAAAEDAFGADEVFTKPEHDVLDRYALYAEIATGGMATVHIARLVGAVGFARTVAIKRLHAHLAKDPEFVRMFLQEGRLASRVSHPNVVPTLDVVAKDGELYLVMEFVAGDTLSRLLRKWRERGEPLRARILSSILCGALEGLHACHEATSERGEPLGIVHRDVSPQNVLVGIDGAARLLDFGVAKATNLADDTKKGVIKGKVAYMAPEQLNRRPLDRRTDVYAASVILWEALTGKRLFQADDVAGLVHAVLHDRVPPPSEVVPSLPAALDGVVLRGLARDPKMRFATAREMAIALEQVLPPAPQREVGEWVVDAAGEALQARLEFVAEIEREEVGRASLSAIPGFAERMASDTDELRQKDSTSGVRGAPRSDRAFAGGGAQPDGDPSVDVIAGLDLPSLSGGRSPWPRRAFWASAALLVAAGAVPFVRPQWVGALTGGGAPTSSTPEPEPPPSAAFAPGAPSSEEAIVIAPIVVSGATSEVAAPLDAGARSGPHVDPELRTSFAPVHGGASPRAVRDPCAIPYVVDAKGVKRTKPECASKR